MSLLETTLPWHATMLITEYRHTNLNFSAPASKRQKTSQFQTQTTAADDIPDDWDITPPPSPDNIQTSTTKNQNVTLPPSERMRDFVRASQGNNITFFQLHN